MSLQYTFSFSKNISLASALQPPFRTDSKPLRRRFAGKTGCGTSRRKFLQNHFRQSFESSPESRGSQTLVCFLVLFAQRKKHEKRSLRREHRGSANLESAHRSRSFAPQQLKPFKEAPRFCKPRINAHKQQIRTIQLNPFAALGGNFRRRCRLFLLLLQLSPPAAALFKGGHFPSKREKEQRRRDRNGQKISNRLSQKYRKGLVRKEIRQNVDKRNQQNQFP